MHPHDLEPRLLGLLRLPLGGEVAPQLGEELRAFGGAPVAHQQAGLHAGERQVRGVLAPQARQQLARLAVLALGGEDERLEQRRLPLAGLAGEDRLGGRQRPFEIAGAVEGRADLPLQARVVPLRRRRAAQGVEGRGVVAALALEVGQRDARLERRRVSRQELGEQRLGLLALLGLEQRLDQEAGGGAVLGGEGRDAAEGLGGGFRLAAVEPQAAESEERLDVLGIEAGERLQDLLQRRRRFGAGGGEVEIDLRGAAQHVERLGRELPRPARRARRLGEPLDRARPAQHLRRAHDQLGALQRDEGVARVEPLGLGEGGEGGVVLPFAGERLGEDEVIGGGGGRGRRRRGGRLGEGRRREEDQEERANRLHGERIARAPALAKATTPLV